MCGSFAWTSVVFSQKVRSLFQSPLSFSPFFLHLLLFRWNYIALEGCKYAPIWPTLANVLGHPGGQHYSSVEKCPSPFHFVSTQLTISLKCLKYVNFIQKLFQTRKIFSAVVLLLYLFIPYVIYWNFVY